MQESVSKYLGFTYDEIVESLLDDGVNISLMPKHYKERKVQGIKVTKKVLREKQQLLKH